MSRRAQHSPIVAPPTRLVIHDFTYATGRMTESVPTGDGARRGRLFKGRVHLIVDADGSALGPTAAKLREAFVDFFHRDASGSITSTLRRAMQHLNELLLEENRRSVRAERSYATVACAVVRAADVYFAVAGRAFCYAVGPTGCERFGRGDPKAGDQPVHLLGQAEDIGVDMFHRPIGQLTGLILASSGIVDLGDGSFESALADDDERLVDLVRSLGARHRGRRRFSAAVLTFDGSEEDRPDRAQVSLPKPISTNVPGEGVASLRNRLFALPPRRVAAPDGDTPNGIGKRPIPRVRRYAKSHLVTESKQVAEQLESARRIGTSRPLEETTATWVEQQQQSRPPLEVILSLRLPPRVSRGVLVVLALAGLFYAGYIGIQVPVRLLRQGSEAAAAIEKLTQAEQRERDALAQPDPLVRRPLLGEAYQLASAAAAQRPDSPAIETAVARIQGEYQASTGVTTLEAPTHVVDLPTAGDQILLVDTDIFVLDRANGRVYSYLLNVDGSSAVSNPNPVLVRGGDHVGPATVGNLGGIAWMPAGGARKENGLLVLDTAGFLLEYEATRGLNLLALSNPESWSSVSQLRGYEGNLYALNRSSRKLIVYQPEQRGYDGASSDYFAATTTVDLSDAETFAVDQDLYLLHASGRIQRFTNGTSSAFADLPDAVTPSKPVGIATSESSVFVGDPTRSRVVQLSRSGVFERVLTVNDPMTLTSLRDLAISVDGKALFVLDGQAIYRFNLPG
jgi:hypothetical protein